MSKRLSEGQYDAFAEQIKNTLYDMYDSSTKAFMACFVVDDKIEYGKKTGCTLEGVQVLIERELKIDIS